MRNLIRREVVEHKQAQQFGETLVMAPLAFKLFVASVAALIVVIGCFLYFGTWTNEQTVRGYILPSKGLITLRSPQGGTVVVRYAKLGERVRKGQRLYAITLERSVEETANVNAALLAQYDAELKTIHEQIALARRFEVSRLARFRNQQRDLQSEFRHLGEQLQTERSILALTEKNLDRYQKLRRTHMVSQAALQQAQQKRLNQLATVQQIEKDQTDLQTQLDQIPGQIAQALVNTANTVADFENQTAEIVEKRLQLQVTQAVVVRAPTAGTISSVIAQVGQTVSNEMPLLSLLPHGSVLEARLLVPTSAIGFVHPDEPVRLRYNAFPYQQFGLYRGKVREVSHSIITPGELELPVNLQAPYYLVTATLAKPYVRAYGRRLQLRAGMTLSADIVLNRERLYQWILQPIASLRGRT